MDFQEEGWKIHAQAEAEFSAWLLFGLWLPVIGLVCPFVPWFTWPTITFGWVVRIIYLYIKADSQ